MKTHTFKSALVASGLALCATSPVFGGDADDKFKRMDSNGDGRVSEVEHAAFAETMFRQTDANYDGQLSTSECEAADAARGGKMDKKSTASHLRMVDTDGNGQISAAENSAYAQSSFLRADKNGDGTLSEDELKDAYKAKKKEMKD